jgi:acyl-coenzyme A thioesterase PaaI-like protein
MDKAFQDYYPDEVSYCYGCGRLNEHGLQIKSHWDGDEAVCVFQPHAYHTAVPGYVYGGLIASLIDCHATGTAAAAAYRAQNRAMDTDPPLRFLTASLHVDYLKPTPIDQPLELRASVAEIKGRKVRVLVELYAHDELCARGEVITIQVPDDFMARLLDPKTND